MKKKIAISITTLLVAGSLVAVPVVANAADASSPSVAASRSFAAVGARSNDLLTESSSVDVSGDSKWESTESLRIDKVQSPAEIQAEEEAKAAEQAAAQAQAEAASRSQERTSTTQSTTTAPTTVATSNVPSSEKGTAMVNEALSHMGQAMWCTDLVTAALAAVGVSFSGWPADYANIPGGVQVGDISAAQPGDVLVYGNSHVAIYMGNGMAVHGGWGGYPNVGTGSATGTSAGLPTAIVRIP